MRFGKTLTVIIPFLLPIHLSARSMNLESIDLSNLPEIDATLNVPAPRGTNTERSGNYYLDANSYDPLLMRSPNAVPETRLHIVGGKIEIPGVNGELPFAKQYRQAAYQRHDIQSDVALTVYSKSLPKKLFQVLFGIVEDNGNPNGGTYTDTNGVVEDPPVPMPTEADIQALDIPQDEKERLLVQLHNASLHIEGRINPFRKDEMLKMIKQIIVEERVNGIQPKYGEPHEWSPEFMRYCREHGEMLPLTMSKLLTALASGTTSRHFKTGKELELINYILSREEASVTMDQMFRHSYGLNNGDVYLTILTIENILSDNWRHPQRGKLAVTRKLANICNFYEGRGDKYGAWYHFHGIMLYGYVRGGFRAALIAATETAGSHVLNLASDQDERQEDFVNSTGGKIGARLAKEIKNGVYADFVPDRNYCDPDVYLNLTEDFRDRIEFVESREFRAEVTDYGMKLKSLNRDYLDCHVEVIYNDRTGELNSQNIVKRDHVDFPKGKNTLIRIDTHNELVKARAFISGCLEADGPGVSRSSGVPGFAPARGIWVDAVR